MPTAVLFDVDGTLIDSYRLYLESYRRALAPVLGRAPTDAEIAARRPSAERRFLEEWLGPERGRECHAAMCRHYEELHAHLSDGIYEGVREMLAALRAAGVPLGVVTGKGRHAWEVVERSTDLGRFAIVVTEDDAEHPKPHPGGLLSAADALGIEPRRIAYIGDSVSDVEAARAAGMLAGAALWPKTTPGDRETFLQQIRPHSPAWTFERPSDVTRAVAPWC